jgi:hypothetical protein
MTQGDTDGPPGAGCLLLGLLVVLISSVSEKELDGLIIEWSHIKAEVLLFAIRNFKRKQDLDLIRLSGDIIVVQGHEIFATWYFLGEPTKHGARDCQVMKICHDFCGKQKNNARQKATISK